MNTDWIKKVKNLVKKIPIIIIFIVCYIGIEYIKGQMGDQAKYYGLDVKAYNSIGEINNKIFEITLKLREQDGGLDENINLEEKRNAVKGYFPTKECIDNIINGGIIYSVKNKNLKVETKGIEERYIKDCILYLKKGFGLIIVGSAYKDKSNKEINVVPFEYDEETGQFNFIEGFNRMSGHPFSGSK